jgi:hypothetical protein
MNKMTSLKFVWRAIGVLPTKVVEENMSLFARAQKEGLAAAQQAAKLSLNANVMTRTGELQSKTKFYSLPNGWRINMTAPYAAIQNAGGWIFPKLSVKWLRIPLPRKRLAPKGERGDFVFKSKKGELLIANRLPGNRLEFLAVLKKQVRIPPQGFLRKAEEAAKHAYETVFNRVMSNKLTFTRASGKPDGDTF